MNEAILALREMGWRRQRRNHPRVPRGWDVSPPDFVGVGAEKSGTTWWYDLLVRHPQVAARGHPKELRYFGRFETFEDWNIEDYARWFPRPPKAINGEWTPAYMVDPRTPDRLAAAAPEARILIMLRDPVERYASGVAMLLRRGITNPAADALRKGLYVSQLERIFRAFPSEQVLVLQYERCIVDFEAQVARTYAFLGLDDAFIPARARRGVNVTREPIDLTPHLRAELVERYTDEVSRLRLMLPHFDSALWPNFMHLA